MKSKEDGTTLLGAYILVWHLNYLDSIMHGRSANLTSCNYDLLRPRTPELCVRTFLHIKIFPFCAVGSCAPCYALVEARLRPQSLCAICLAVPGLTGPQTLQQLS